MNRSEINLYINEAITLFAQCGFHLPPFAFWTPDYYHWNKREDIINRGGGELTLELYLAGENNGLSENGFTVSVDGVSRSGVPGEKITLLPRSLTPGCGV